MKITNIEKHGYIFHVTLTPNFFERIIGLVAKTVKYRDSGREFAIGGGTVYIREDGEKTDNFSRIGHELDKWCRKQAFLNT